MEDLLSIKALAAIKGITIKQLAENSGIGVSHLQQVSAGRYKMTAEDLRKLSAFTGIPSDRIKV